MSMEQTSKVYTKKNLVHSHAGSTMFVAVVIFDIKALFAGLK